MDLPPGVWKCPRGGNGKWCSDGALDAGLVVERGSDLLGDERSLSHAIVRRRAVLDPGLGGPPVSQLTRRSRFDAEGEDIRDAGARQGGETPGDVQRSACSAPSITCANKATVRHPVIWPTCRPSAGNTSI